MHVYCKGENVTTPDNLYIMVNAYWEPLSFELPSLLDQDWHRFVDTMREAPLDALESGEEERLGDQKSYKTGPRSVVVLVGRA